MRFARAILYGIATLLMYLGIPLLGWGLGDISGYFSNLPRLGYAIVVGLLSLAIGIQAYGGVEGIDGRKGKAGKLVFRQAILRYVLEISMYIALIFIPSFDRHSIGVIKDITSLRWLGVGFCLVGYWLIFWSGLILGRQYSADVTIQEDHHLITRNIYHFIRHPRYLGIMALSLGVSFTFRSWIGLIASVYFLGMLLYRIKDEEDTMHKEFGVEWDEYCKQTRRLIPFIY